MNNQARAQIVKLLKDCAWQFMADRVSAGEDSHPHSKGLLRLQDRCNRWIEKLEAGKLSLPPATGAEIETTLEKVGAKKRPQQRCAYWWERRTPGKRYVNARGQCKRYTGHPSGYCADHRPRSIP